MSEQITAEQIDELKANNYKLTTGTKSRKPWWAYQAYGELMQPNACDTFSAAARAAWAHYQQAKRPAKPQYPSGWVESSGFGYKVQDVLWDDYTNGWVVNISTLTQTISKSASTVRPCPPRPEPPKGWKLTGRVSVDCEHWIPIIDEPVRVNDAGNYCNTDKYEGLRWEAVRDVPQEPVPAVETTPSPSQVFSDELRALLNSHSKENDSNTPDFILASYLLNCLDAFNDATNHRDRWYSIKPSPGWRPARPE